MIVSLSVTVNWIRPSEPGLRKLGGSFVIDTLYVNYVWFNFLFLLGCWVSALTLMAEARAKDTNSFRTFATYLGSPRNSYVQGTYSPP